MRNDDPAIHFRLTGRYSTSDSVKMKVKQDGELLFDDWVQLNGSKRFSLHLKPSPDPAKPIKVFGWLPDEGEYPDWLEGNAVFKDWKNKVNRLKINYRRHNYIRDI